MPADPSVRPPGVDALASAPPPPEPRLAATEIDSQALLNGQREIVIRHGGECYRLRHTRNDKLILTK